MEFLADTMRKCVMVELWYIVFINFTLFCTFQRSWFYLILFYYIFLHFLFEPNANASMVACSQWPWRRQLRTSPASFSCGHQCLCGISHLNNQQCSMCLEVQQRFKTNHSVLFLLLQIWEDCINKGHPGQEHQSVQRSVRICKRHPSVNY